MRAKTPALNRENNRTKTKIKACIGHRDTNSTHAMTVKRLPEFCVFCAPQKPPPPPPLKKERSGLFDFVCYTAYIHIYSDIVFNFFFVISIFVFREHCVVACCGDSGADGDTECLQQQAQYNAIPFDFCWFGPTSQQQQQK